MENNEWLSWEWGGCRWLEGKNTVMGGRLSGKKEEVGMGFMNNSDYSQRPYRLNTCRVRWVII